MPPKETVTRSASRSREYSLASRFPSATQSRRMSWGVFGKVVRTRPVCAYPAVAKYKGSGSTDEAESFTCATH